MGASRSQHLANTLVLTLMLAGCAKYHVVELDAGADVGDTSGRDTFVPPDTLVPPDTVTPDTSVPEDTAPLEECVGEIVEERFNTFCLLDPSGSFPAGEAFRFPIQTSGCFCVDELICRARVRGRRLELDVSRCHEDADCDGCVTSIDAMCDVPPLLEGRVDVYVNGELLYRVNAVPPEPGEPTPRCVDVQPTRCDDPPNLGVPFLPELSICHPSLSDVGTEVELRIDGCTECGAIGCQAQLTRDGIEILQITESCDDECGDCGAPIRCVTPALAAGVYPIIVDGVVTSELVVEDTDGPPPPDEICRSL